MRFDHIAEWRGPTPNKTPGAMDLEPRGLILHIQEGTQNGSIAWCLNPQSKVSAHFFAARDGSLAQLVDTADMAWAEVDGNPHWISVECEGYTGDVLTEPQTETVARLLAALYEVYSFPLQVSNDPSSVPGVTGHGLGGAAYGGHTDCPGAPILAQRPDIIARAAEMLGLSGGPGMQITDSVTIDPGWAERYPRTAPDGFRAGAVVSVEILLVGSAIRAMNNEYLIGDLGGLLTALTEKVVALETQVRALASKAA